jgi:hypothetical protein
MNEELLKCDSSCKMCENNKTKCTACALNRTIPPFCFCKTGFYEIRVEDFS